MSSRLGIIDLGTNTFHLLIVEQNGSSVTTLFRESKPARIGMGGINKKIITDEAIGRALDVLHFFRKQLDVFSVPQDKVFAFGTSAIRNADNKEAFCETVMKETAIPITVINGNEEAEYIYKGVRYGTSMGSDPSLIMDIGGGSVEYIIGNEEQIFWKQSFEIGGQRLMEKYMTSDPLPEGNRKKLYNYLDDQLIPLANAIHQYAPQKIVGSSGTFDTLIDMDFQHRTGEWPPKEQTDFRLPLEEFYRVYELILAGDHDQRMSIPGMIPLRVDMIVVAMCLIDFVLRRHQIREIQVSSYALKEGVLATLLGK
ncbi:MAG TPA: phosphatase [Dyadobacter sp.]|jgi:exopolyphosphatase/guanosine-5'-triphosphate,3'-diphosphate pyrophosphatase|nr:phosphatase [Dyadobacter sp.]